MIAWTYQTAKVGFELPIFVLCFRYYPFSYTITKCPNSKGPKPINGSGQCSGIDTWCPIPGPESQFYDDGLANDTIARIRWVLVLSLLETLVN